MSYQVNFRKDNHISGKVYDLTQENMTAMIIYIDELEKQKEELQMVIDQANYILKRGGV